MSVSPDDRDRIADDLARQLLARAAVLDQDSLSLAQLRASALEAGISAAAFDQAVREWRSHAPTRAPPRWTQRVIRNLGALTGGWITLAGFAAIDRLLALPWLVHKLTDPVGLLVGTVIATKLRARAAAIVMGGLAISQGAEFLMDLLAGAPAIHGFYSHIALMVAGVGGVAASQWWRSRGGPADTSPFSPASSDAMPPATDTDSPDTRGVGLTNAEAAKRFVELLRLRRNFYLTRMQLS